jgi:choline dehydrogenase-like flavoprotein
VAMLEPVDVVIIGAGASGGAVAWSLAETRMKILCLEQGDWVKPTDYPSNFRDSEALQMGAFSPSPNRRGGTADYPINEENSPIKVVNFNGYAGHYPRFHPLRTFACERWTGWLTTGRSITAHLNPGTQRTTG